MATTNTALHQVQRDIEERGLQQLALGMHRITAVRGAAPTSSIERCLTDWGVLADSGYTEPDTCEIPMAMAQAMQRPGAQLAVSCWRGFWRLAGVSLLAAGILTLAGCGGGGADDDEVAPPRAPVQRASSAALVGQPVGSMSPVSLAEAITADVVVSYRPGPTGTYAVAADQSRTDCEGANDAHRPCVVVATAADGYGAQMGKWLLADSMRVTYCDLIRSTTPQQDIERCAAVALAAWRIR